MRIIDRKAFLAMPAGTLFSKYEPCFFGDLLIKGDSLPNDFCYQQIADAVKCNGSDEYERILEEARESGKSFSMDFDCQGRDGCFDGPDVFFAIWEPADVQALINRLVQTLPDATHPA